MKCFEQSVTTEIPQALKPFSLEYFRYNGQDTFS